MNPRGNPITTNVTPVRLADGRELQVVRFDGPPAASRTDAQSAPAAGPSTDARGDVRSAPPEEPRRLHVCPACECELVHPVEIPAPTEDGFELVLRCPNCERIERGGFGDELIGPFADELDRGEAEMRRALDSLARENMAEHVERLVAALRVDTILPEDF